MYVCVCNNGDKLLIFEKYLFVFTNFYILYFFPFLIRNRNNRESQISNKITKKYFCNPFIYFVNIKIYIYTYIHIYICIVIVNSDIIKKMDR